MQKPKRWVVLEADDRQVHALAEELGVSPILARLLWRRGLCTVEDAQRFLYPGRDGFSDPYLMRDMDKAVARIRSAIDRKERMMIYGDYDADGATSTALLFLALREIGADVETYIPDRFSEGYGLNGPAIQQAKERGFDLVITVDNGISAVEEVRLAREIGLDLIVTDHHTPPEILPDAYAILNPKQPGCNYPEKMLAGVGVAWKLVQALYERLPEEFLDLAAIGTVADLAPLQGENRLITLFGLEAMNAVPRPGVRALIEVAGLQDKQVTAGHIGFSFGPRINASGRLDSATYAVELLTTTDTEKAKELAEFLDARNRERQEIGEGIFEQAVALVEAHPEWLEGRVLVVPSSGWNEGVIGIVASRLVERYYRPTLMIALNGEGSGKSSARSIHGFDLYAALTKCADLLGHYGGHKMAAGFSIAEERIDELRRRMNDIAQEALTDELMQPKIDVDMVLDLGEVNLQLVEQMERLAPYGFGNPSPRFSFEGLQLEQTRVVGKDATHLQMRVKRANQTLDCIAFRRSEDQPALERLASIDIVGELAINEWKGRRNLQVLLGDWRANAVQCFDKRGCGDKAVWLETRKEPLTVLFFQEPNLREIEKRLFGYPWNEDKYRLVLVDATGRWERVAGGDRPTDHVVLYDLPQTVAQVEAALAELQPAQKLYVIHGEADEQYCRHAEVNWLPERNAFTYAYRLLQKQETLSYEQMLQEMRPLTQEGVETILAVFTELEFALQEGNQYAKNSSATRRELSEAPTYQQQAQRFQHLKQVREKLLVASHDTLREWLVTLLLRQA
ncbi:single-stranded-DNA-specific exonuclease RecJ [Tumebacillus permanentifrigoris]|uniref:Single-stranded-DNA-specific exonuclease RecJ n=1 Tax=Tumebacillus permanentifrigoris TaxID=378543 RepID=A0A316D625_9BACL|nr:single-stranded-DNA-specific exonuclease RecJ [Tumebacillus permanentifrigoris]PWK08984.1 single-stranded-DNA-specific exonuclease [Tumebacillus permanentifrigoris]